jgi:GT2 family glycosyltransferase
VSRAPTVLAIVPVLDGRAELERSLPALISAGQGVLDAVIVVDDGSQDGSAEFARSCGARVVSTGGRALGPARARNVGARAESSDVLVFVDADVVVHADAITLLVGALEAEDVVAAYGAYDDTPGHRGFASLYMNLRHHHGHRQPSDDALTFWSGLGVIRSSAFEAARGFDAEAYPLPSIEDIDLGRRLRTAGGRVRRLPSARGTHLKRWTLPSVIHTDVVRRALPWSKLLLRHGDDVLDLNVNGLERVKAVVALVLVLNLVLALLGVVPGWVPVAWTVVAFAANVSLFRVFRTGGGTLFAVAATLFHQLYYIYSTATYVTTLMSNAVLRKR